MNIKIRIQHVQLHDAFSFFISSISLWTFDSTPMAVVKSDCFKMRGKSADFERANGH
jgi:hypothetical protein